VAAVRFERRSDTITAVTFAYDPTIVGTIKLVVPLFLRSWNPARRERSILEPVYATQLAQVLRGAGHTVIGLDPPNHYHGNDPAAWARAVFQRVGPHRAPVACRLLSRLCHPDTRSGDHQLMQELNQAYRLVPRMQRSLRARRCGRAALRLVSNVRPDWLGNTVTRTAFDPRRA
jgi:hypothetical protein